MSSARMRTMSGCMLVPELKKEVVKEVKRKRTFTVDIFHHLAITQ